MSNKIEIVLPKMGESVDEATITGWLKNEGDDIKEDDLIVEIATDKVDSEVPSEVSGVLIQKLCKINDVVKVGDPIAIIETDKKIEYLLLKIIKKLLQIKRKQHHINLKQLLPNQLNILKKLTL